MLPDSHSWVGFVKADSMTARLLCLVREEVLQRSCLSLRESRSHEVVTAISLASRYPSGTRLNLLAKVIVVVRRCIRTTANVP